MSKNVIAITGYNKSDLLFIYLSQLYLDNTIENYKIQIHTEVGYSKDQDEVIDFYKKLNPNVEITQIIKEKNPNHQFIGFYNILSSYLIARKEAAEFVIIGEEDILPTKDYIRFNKYIYDNFLKKYPRIIGAAHKRRPETEKEGDPEILIGDYQCTSLSVISVEAIDRYLSIFLEDESLYTDTLNFYINNFSKSRMGFDEHCHHDGAIERIMEYHQLFALKPDQARSMHVGLSGIFCKGNPPQGTLEERISQWRELIKDGDKIRSLSTNPDDIVVTDPEGPTWDKLELDINRDRAKASSWWYDKKNEFKEYIEI